MTHSPDGDSGVGDHGEAGLKAFVDQHRCNEFCIRLGLGPANPLSAATHSTRSVHGEEGGEEEDDDNEEEEDPNEARKENEAEDSE
ncbi:uncharacterized protein STEHIDRAFT_158328 [Stereum hirsutum FP-91666 SS1]|uniref:uncharacterized protein n=1 Tax=Stereum hirsutum (strain FP-91666) TaxID=721885 RepID=UPI0004449293|nr:uncharacterized protein STEHIDRAFT_158328 [Stereum hirsutum FP-91666 SS1]EIM85704.1 hypothetical protein STEHIDRAFT_158328 [Stereum hirsutum FP-91666 SS1]